MVQVDQHDDPGFSGHTSQGNEAHSNCDREVVAKPPHEPDAANQRERHRQHDDQSLRQSPEVQVQQQENEQQRYWHNEFHFLDGTLHGLKLTAPCGVVAGRELDLVIHCFARLGDVATDVTLTDVHKNVGR